MADENSKPFVDKISDGFQAVGNTLSDVGGAVSSKASDFIDSLDPEKRAAEEARRLSEQKANFEKLQNMQYAQVPSPAAVFSGERAPLSTPGLNEFLQNPTSGVDQLRVNAEADYQGRPLDATEEARVRGQKIPTDPNLKGTGTYIARLPEESAPQQAQMASSIDIAAPKYPFQGSYNTAAKAIEIGNKAGLALASAKAKMADEKLLRETEYADRMQKLQDGFNVQYQEKIDGLNQNVKEYRALAGEKIIPGALLARQDTQASIMTGLSIALGALSGAYTGSNSNIGLELINKAIDRDVEAQRFNLDTKVRLKQSEVSTNQNLLSQMREKFGDDKSAYLATKVAMLSMAEEKFNSEINKKGGAAQLSTNASALQALAQLKAQKETYELQLRQAQEQAFSQAEMLKGANKYNMTNEQAMALYGPKEAEKYVQGFGLALSKEDKAKFQESYGDSKASIEGLNKILSMDIEKMNPVKRAEVASQVALLVGRMRLAVLGPGPMTDDEYKRLLDTIGNPNEIIAFPGTQIKKLQTVKKSLEEQQQSQIKQFFGEQTFNDLQQRQGKINFK